MTQTVTQHNVETGEIITRELTEEEIAQNLFLTENAEKERQEKKAKEMARAALLKKLGITEDEAQLLLA